MFGQEGKAEAECSRKCLEIGIKKQSKLLVRSPTLLFNVCPCESHLTSLSLSGITFNKHLLNISTRMSREVTLLFLVCEVGR